VINLTNIYALADPRDGYVKYIGKTNNPKVRLWDHEKGGRLYNKTIKERWINKLQRLGLSPLLFIVDEVPESEWEFWEQHYISLFRSWGFKLTNLTLGGVGAVGSKKPLLKGIVLIRKGKTFEEIYGEEKAAYMRKRISDCRKLEVRDYSYLREIATKRKGTKISEEVKSKMKASSANRGLFGGDHWASKSIIQYSRSGEFIKEWDSVAEAARSLGIFASNISVVLHGKEKTAAGFIWRFKNAEK
jgi:hypothetical protein